MRCTLLPPVKRGDGDRQERAGWVVSTLLVVVTSLLVSCSSGKSTDQEPAPIPITVGKAARVQGFQTVPVSGSIVSPDAPSNVSFLVSGKVVRVVPREGDHVKKGQVLAVIDPEDYRLALDASTARVAEARVALRRASDEYERMKYLYESKSLAPNDFEKYKAAFEGAGRQVEQALAGERLSRKKLSDATLHAPVSGYITRRGIEPGEMASPGRPVFEIARLDPVEVSVGVPETDIHLVRAGEKAVVTVPALPGRTFTGSVRVVNVAADPATRTYMTRIVVPNPGHVLKLGMVAEAKIRSDRKIDLITITGDAVVRDSRGVTSVFVYHPREKRVYAKRVEIGTVHGTDVEVRSGLTGDDMIVTAAQDRLKDGAPVSVRNTAGDNGSAGPEGN